MQSELEKDFRLIAMDLRGHGRSDKPSTGYDDAQNYAEDIRAVLDELALHRPMLVGWSFGGITLFDYLNTYGTTDIAGCVLVGSRSRTPSRDAVEQLDSTDVEESVGAMTTFVRKLVHEDLPSTEFYYLLGFNMVVPPRVRREAMGRSDTYEDLLRDITIPTRVVHGAEDALTPVDQATEMAEKLPNAELSIYQSVGHSPFWERPEKFNTELREFAIDI
jgi:pimeloyl-ACP methyl ester carboxylesterase